MKVTSFYLVGYGEDKFTRAKIVSFCRAEIALLLKYQIYAPIQMPKHDKVLSVCSTHLFCTYLCPIHYLVSVLPFSSVPMSHSRLAPVLPLSSVHMSHKLPCVSPTLLLCTKLCPIHSLISVLKLCCLPNYVLFITLYMSYPSLMYLPMSHP